MLAGTVEELVTGVPAASRERAIELFRSLRGRNDYVPRLQSWLEQNRSSLPEPIQVENLDGLHDGGVDVVVRGLRSGRRVGFQVKSDRDVGASDFRPRLQAQLFQAQNSGIELMVVIFACRPTEGNVTKINYWANVTQQLASWSVLCLQPERAAGLFDAFDHSLQLIGRPSTSWQDFFRAVHQPQRAFEYLDPWPALEPDQRYLPPQELPALRSALEEHRLVFLVGPPAVGKTYTAVQLLWQAHCAGRPVHWLTASDVEPTEGPIARGELDWNERAGFQQRVESQLRALGPQPGRGPADVHDIVSHLLDPEALVYVEDPFGKTEDAYDVSLASHEFLDFHHLVEILASSTARLGCRILLTSRDPLFQRWLRDPKVAGWEIPKSSVVHLSSSSYPSGLLFRHLVLLARSRGIEAAEDVADVLAERVETPWEADLLVRRLLLNATARDAEDALDGWTGSLRAKVEGQIAPRSESEAVALLTILAFSSREMPESPAHAYSRLHQALELPGEPSLAFQAALGRLGVFLTPRNSLPAGEARSYEPNHSVVREVMVNELALPGQRPLLRRIARILPEIPPVMTPRARPPFHRITGGRSWASHLQIAVLLVGLGIALEGEQEEAALGKVVFELGPPHRSEMRRLMSYWRELPESLREGFFARLRDAQLLREVAAFLPFSRLDASSAWRVLDLLLDESQRGCLSTIFGESPWSYLCLHLHEAPETILCRLDEWARTDAAFFVYALGEELLLHWDHLAVSPERLRLWRGAFFVERALLHGQVQDRLIGTIARHWSKAPQSLKELFDLHSRSANPTYRGRVGSQALFYADTHPQLERYAIEAARDEDPSVGLETFRWGSGDEIHRQVAEILLADASPGLAAAMTLNMAESRDREESLWEKEARVRCIRLGGDAARAACVYLSLNGEEGRQRAERFGLKPSTSPFEEPDVVRAEWIWAHLSSGRMRPELSDEELERLLCSLQDRDVRDCCLFYASCQLVVLPERFEQLLQRLSEASQEDAAAIAEGTKRRQPKDGRETFRFPILEMSS